MCRTVSTLIPLFLWVTVVQTAGAKPRPQAAEQPDAAAPSVVSGSVVNAATGQPIPRALVRLNTGERSVLAGADGKFRFEGVTGTQATLDASKPGFFSESPDNPAPFTVPLHRQYIQEVDLRASPEPIVLKLLPEGVVFGSVTGVDGNGVEGISVNLVYQEIANGRRRWIRIRGAETGEDGEFRIAELQPGRYVISVGPGRSRVVPVSQDAKEAFESYPIVYYPEANDFQASTPLEITPGARQQVNFSESPEPFFRISGRVTGSSGERVSLNLESSTGETIWAGTQDPATGDFRSGWVPRGSYRLHAEQVGGQRRLSATLPLAVASNVTNLTIALAPAAAIPIHYRMDTTGDPPAFFPGSIVLTSADSSVNYIQFGANYEGPSGNQSLALRDVDAGTYWVEIDVNRLYVQSATSGTTDLLREPLLIDPGNPAQPIEIVLRDDGATLTGIVSSKGEPEVCSVIAIPDAAPSQARTAATNDDGSFSISDLAPGTYKVLALENLRGIEYKNPESVRDLLEKAQEVTLAPQQNAKIELQLMNGSN